MAIGLKYTKTIWVHAPNHSAPLYHVYHVYHVYSHRVSATAKHIGLFLKQLCSYHGYYTDSSVSVETLVGRVNSVTSTHIIMTVCPYILIHISTCHVDMCIEKYRLYIKCYI